MDAALDDAEVASRQRDQSPADIPRGLRGKIGLAALRAGLRNGSIQVRHALRTAVAVLLALLVSLILPNGDPLLPTLLVTTFAIVQISWRATLLRTRDRVLGVLAGGVLVVILLLVLPHALLLPMSLVGLAVGMWFITARPAISIAAMLVMSVGLNTGLRHLDPVGVVIQYIALALTAVVIGGVVGFAIIPAWRPRPLPTRVAAAVSRVATVLSALSSAAAHETPKQGLRLLEQAQAATQQLVPDREQLDAHQQDQLEQLRTTLNDLTATALFAVARNTPGTPGALLHAAEILNGPATVRAPHGGRSIDSAVLLLASSASKRKEALLSSLRAAKGVDLRANERRS